MNDPDQLKAEADAAFRSGQLEPARDLYRAAIDARPDWAAAHNNLAMVLRQLGDRAGAEFHFRAVLDIDPTIVSTLSNLGALLIEVEKLEEAQPYLSKALEQAPDNPGVLYNAALLSIALEDYAAAAALEKSIAQNPSYAQAHCNLGIAYRKLGRLDDSIGALGQALVVDPSLVEGYINLAAAQSDAGDTEGAVASGRRAIELDPQSADAHYNLGNALNRLPDYQEALIQFEHAVALNPLHSEASVNRAKAYWSLGRQSDAYASLRTALSVKPDYAAAHSNLVFKSQYDPNISSTSLYAEARSWNAAHGIHPAPARPTSANFDPDRPVRVGYLSPHLTVHPVGYFLEPVLAHHDPARVTAVCYADTAANDEQTEKLKALGSAWHQVDQLNDEDLAARIRDDEIDILIDLDGHSGPNRLPVFARRAASIQVTWAGYVGTTGLDAMDYLLTDHRQTIVQDLELMTEQPVYMLGNYVAYAPIDDAPDVGLSPSDANGFVTFGCFNNLDKINDQVIALWAKVLDAVPDSRLSLINFSLGDPHVRARIASAFVAHGISAGRLDLHGKRPRHDLLTAYNSIDIALDPFPYSGGLTTIEALWMGVPVITKRDGDRFASRHSVTHLTAVGLTDCIADDSEDYLNRAIALAQDPQRRAALRSGLREQMRGSPVCDGAGFTQALERAYRIMWQRHCAGDDPSPIEEADLRPA
ncbi:MAG: tetratricopeptide repeat protein [Rhodospirillaceae bacterium]|nr:tetratricopeptide repeat protein [Rhodospirillaceae bacterium]